MFSVNGVFVQFAHITPTKLPFSSVFSRFTDCGIFSDEDEGEDLNYLSTSKNTLGTGTAYCLKQDNFEKAFGRKLSLTRALEDSGLPKEVRTAVWETYFDMVKK